MTELDDLIKEQERELRAGKYQYHEPFVVFSIDQIAHQGGDGGKMPLSDLVWDEDTLRMPASSKNHPWSGCPLHGVGQMRYMPSGRLYCRECSITYLRDKRRARGVKPRNWCPHEGEFLRVTPKGHKYCGECTKTRNAVRRAGVSQKA